jgi:hypothetical protein
MAKSEGNTFPSLLFIIETFLFRFSDMKNSITLPDNTSNLLSQNKRIPCKSFTLLI